MSFTGSTGSAGAAADAAGPVWAVIPARYESTRFPGKPLAELAGKPMIQHVVERTAKAPSMARVLVATDDDRIAAAVRDFGGEVVRTGPQPTGTDRIAAAVALAEEAGAPAPEWVLNVQGDEPLIDPQDLERLVGGVTPKDGAVMGTLVFPLDDPAEFDDPNVVKAVLDRQGRALYFSRAPVPHPRATGNAVGGRCGWRHLGVYIFRREFLRTFQALPPTPLAGQEGLEQLRALEHGHPIHCVEARNPGLGVDVPADLEKVRALLER